jgi:hypothetical protein
LARLRIRIVPATERNGGGIRNKEEGNRDQLIQLKEERK